MYDQIPLKCQSCGKDTMVDFLRLEKRPHSNLITLLGFACSNCGKWETVSIETAATKELLAKINKVNIGSTRYKKLMYKAITKIENLLVKVEEEMRHGKSTNSH